MSYKIHFNKMKISEENICYKTESLKTDISEIREIFLEFTEIFSVKIWKNMEIVLASVSQYNFRILKVLFFTEYTNYTSNLHHKE